MEAVPPPGMMYLDMGLVIVGALVAVAWSTLLERKFLGGFQWRKGPNKMRAKGAAQPLGDAVKLLIKGARTPIGRGGVFIAAPVFSMAITLGMWSIWHAPSSWSWTAWGGALFLCLSSVHILGVLGAGWGRNSTFAFLGAARGVALVLSYEIAFVTGVLRVWILRQRVALRFDSLAGGAVFFILAPLLALALAETQRAPFDFVEAESELVSGFNVEYRAWGFVLLFLSEYGAIIFLGQFLGGIFFPGGAVTVVMLGLILSARALAARAVYPRLKVASWMIACWLIMVPITLLALGGALVLFVASLMNSPLPRGRSQIGAILGGAS